MKASIYLLLIIIFTLLTNACYVSEIKLESAVNPLPQEQLNMRLFGRDFSNDFIARLSKARVKA